MDHPCHKCGHNVEDGKAFCSQCGAPQIRVALPEPAPPATASTLPVSELSTFSLDPPRASGALRAPFISTEVEWRRAFWYCAGAGLISVVAMSLRLIGPLLAVFGAGVLAVLLYYRRSPARGVSARSGAKIGALTGLLSSAVPAFFFALFATMLQAGGETRNQLMDALQQFVSKSNDPQVQATFDLLKTPEGLTKLIVAMVGFLLISIAAACIAGGLTGAFLGRRKRP